MKSKLWMLALAALVPAGLAFAEPGDQETGQIVYTHEPLPVAVPARPPVAQIASVPLTRAQKQALEQGRLVRPGIYLIRSVLSGRCLTVMGSGVNPPSETWDCNRTSEYGFWEPARKWVVLPHPLTGYTLRAHPQRVLAANARPDRYGELGACLSAARGVIFGPPRIELQPCEPQDGDWTRAGADYQRYFILPSGGRSYSLTNAESGDAYGCVSLSNSGRDNGTGVIRWPCAQSPDHIWELEWVGPVPTDYENTLLSNAQWYRTPSGHFNILGAEGVDLTGPTYSRFDTANDGGDYCRKRCAELDQCKAWTWMAPNYVTNANDPPKCLWKSAAGEAINRGPDYFAKVRSGIVRP